jgi:hypothetical protein
VTAYLRGREGLYAIIRFLGLFNAHYMIPFLQQKSKLLKYFHAEEVSRDFDVDAALHSFQGKRKVSLCRRNQCGLSVAGSALLQYLWTQILQHEDNRGFSGSTPAGRALMG